MRNILIILSVFFTTYCYSQNVVILFTDDAEYIDHSFAGGYIDTPNLDFLAEQGTLMVNGYNQSRCSPSRAALLSGMFPQNVGLAELAAKNTQHPTQLGHFSLNHQMMSEWFQENGYETYMTGKWHLGYNGTPMPFENSTTGTAVDFLPQNRGFDHWSGLHHGTSDYYGQNTSSFSYLRIDDVPMPIPDPSTFYTTDWFGDQAVNYITNAVEPFFLYVPITAPHNPIQAPQDGVLLQKYIDKLNSYIDLSQICEDANFQMAVSDISECKATRSYEANKKVQSREIDIIETAKRAAMMEQFDVNVGKIIAAVQAKGEMENTIFIYASDNGGQQNDTFSYVYQCPFRGFKATVREGGIKTPIVFYQQGKTLQQTTSQVIHLYDIFPTLVDLINDNQITTTPQNDFVGVSLKNTLLEGVVTDRCVITHFNDDTAIISNGYKLYSPNLQGTSKELYNIACDNYETNNIADTLIDTLNVLEQKRIDFLNQNNIISSDSINILQACYPNCAGY